MIFYLHYTLMTSGLSGASVLLAVFIKTYTDASQSEIGALLMIIPFVSLIIKPLFCSMADRHQAHRLYLVLSLLIEMVGFAPFVIIPFFPTFYTLHPRAAWYILVAACLIGNGGLGVAWSLGDCLTMNYSQKTGTPFGRMRMMGPLSYGVSSFIIGQFNEWPILPKYVPAFITLQVCLFIELFMLSLWNKQDFEMVDTLAQAASDTCETISDKNKLEDGHRPTEAKDSYKNARRNPQLILLKMILSEDGRIIKYICLFTIFGVLIAPMYFIFPSMEELCARRDYNFSQLAGAVLITQGLIETLAFLVVPWCMCYISKSNFMAFGFIIMSLKWFFYWVWYFTTDISPYWALISELSHGLSCGIFITISAHMALEFANLSQLFIPELRKLGFLTQTSLATREQIEAEERGIKMALRATMQALFGGSMDCLGIGAGSLLCGFLIDMYSYMTLWQVFFVITSIALVLHQIAELSRSRWSDTYEPHKGTKAYEIMQLTRVYLAEIANRRNGHNKNSTAESTMVKPQSNG